MYVKYAVELQFREKVYGGLPKHPDLLEEHIERIAGKDDEFLAKVKEEVQSGDDPTDEQLKELAQKSWTGFKSNEDGLYLSDYQIKAMLKMANDTLKLKGYTASKKQTIQHGLFIKPVRIHFIAVVPPDGVHPSIPDRRLMEPDGFDEKAGTVRDVRTGQSRSILRRADYVSEARLKFEVWVVDNRAWPEEELRSCFELGQEIGLGSMRSYENGKFDLLKFEKIKQTGR